MNISRICFVLIAVTTIWLPFRSIEAAPWGKIPQEEIQWGNDLEQARALANQTGKPILIHFFSDSCPPCRMMESNTFPNSTIVRLVQSSFIPVKFNTNRIPGIAQQFGITAVPTDIILMPNGQRLNMSQGGQDVGQYQQFLNFSLQRYQQITASQRPVPQPVPPQPVTQVPSQSESQSQVQPQSQTQGQASTQTTIRPMGSCPINQTPSFDYDKIPEEHKSKIEFEGYCPVELGTKLSWVRGDYNIREEFDGRIYLFAGQAQKEEFKRNPAKYAPAYQGVDLVAWKETGKRVQGTRYYGAWATGRVFLFSSEENLVKFERNARYYIPPQK